MTILPLSCKVQQYAWGKPGSSSKVAEMVADTVSIQHDAPYAETALSIQAHPDKPLAQKLHRERPDLYKDDNHKPEMCIALTTFEGMCGFKPVQQIAAEVKRYKAVFVPALLSESDYATLQENKKEEEGKVLKMMLTRLMEADEATVTKAIETFLRAAEEGEHPIGSIEALGAKLQTQYKNDVGVLCPFLLNYIRLQPGEAFFMMANEPHAYLAGDAIECMATSDNVVRAGLTPKFKDVPTLLSMLTYEAGEAIAKIVQPTRRGQFSNLYVPRGIDEFSVLHSAVPKDSTESLGALGGPALMLVIDGEGTLNGSIPVKKGWVGFISADDEITITSSTPSPLQAYTAFCHMEA